MENLAESSLVISLAFHFLSYLGAFAVSESSDCLADPRYVLSLAILKLTLPHRGTEYPLPYFPDGFAIYLDNQIKQLNK